MAPQLASATSLIPPPPNVPIATNTPLNNEEQVFLSPIDSNIVLANWRDFRLGFRQIGIGRSTDGGQTWIDTLIEPDMQNIFILTGQLGRQSDPTMTVDAAGNFYMSVLDYVPASTSIYDSSIIAFYKSTDKGISWTGPVANVSQFGPFFEDKQFITTDRTGGAHDGNLYMSWTRFPNPDRMMFVRSIDGGASFEDTVLVGPTQTSTGCGANIFDAGQFSIPIVSSNGDVHVFWMGFALDSSGSCTGQRTIKHVVSSDGGQTFTYEDTLLGVSGYTAANGGINTYSQPVGDADITGGPFDGNIYIAFTNRGNEDGAFFKTDVDFVRSTDNGLTWSNRIQINDATDFEKMDAFHPWLLVNEEGVLIVVFYDQRFDPGSYFLFDLLASYSFDGGLTFTSNRRISDTSSSPSSLLFERQVQDQWLMDNPDAPLTPLASGPQAGLIGEYIGVTAFHDKVIAVWTDSRQGNSDVYSASWYLALMEPLLIAPDKGFFASPSPDFKWATSWKNDLDRYRFEIAADSDFVSVITTRVIDTNSLAFDSTLGDGKYFWRVKTFNTSETDSSEYSDVRSFSVGQSPNYFTEIFTENDNDLSGKTLIFTPDSSTGEFYRFCGESADSFPTNPSGGTVIILGDDHFTQWALADGKSVSLYGTNYTSVYISSNGYLTFGAGSAGINESLAEHFGPLPHISGLYDDLNPGAGGTIYEQQFADRAVVTFEGVPEFGTLNSNSFQISMYFDGTILITLLSIDALDGLTGLSDGSGLPGGFQESDLSSFAIVCGCSWFPGDADGSRSIDVGDVTFVIKYIFQQGAAPNPVERADADGGGDVNVADATYLIKFIFQSGDAPICP